MAELDPSKPSGSHQAMSRHWTMVRDVLGGAETMRRNGSRYLPQLPRESTEDWRYRVSASPFVNIYADIATNIAAKPFANEVTVAADAPQQIIDLAEDIDGQGNSLHVYAERTFFSGLTDAMSWILVDHTTVPTGITIAQEKAIGARPYWLAIDAPDVLSAKWAMVEGEHQIVEARLAERATIEREEKTEEVERVRIMKRPLLEGGGYGTAVWELWEHQKRHDRQGLAWVMIDEGPITIGRVPLVPFVAGREVGQRLVSVLGDVLELQVEHFQRESALKAARTMTAFPMLSASGVEAPADGQAISVGPGVVLYGPASGDGKAASWSFIEPAATSLTFLSDDIDRLEKQMRELGRQPLTASTGNLTVVTTAFAASKANSVVEALALNLKDALEQALRFTAMWLSLTDEPEVAMSTDFDVGMMGDTGSETLLTMHERNAISTKTLWVEMRRRNVLSPNFDPDQELANILAEIPGDDYPDDVRDAI